MSEMAPAAEFADARGVATTETSFAVRETSPDDNSNPVGAKDADFEFFKAIVLRRCHALVVNADDPEVQVRLRDLLGAVERNGGPERFTRLSQGKVKWKRDEIEAF
jgi:hypothetical protein